MLLHLGEDSGTRFGPGSRGGGVRGTYEETWQPLQVSLLKDRFAAGRGEKPLKGVQRSKLVTTSPESKDQHRPFLTSSISV